MKKFILFLFCLFSIVANADEIKMALLQPRVAKGSDACRPIELNMVRGELRKAFGWQSDFQVLTRTDVDAMLEEQGFQRTGMVDDNQRKRVGVMTGAQYICVSTITKDGTQLYIESYLVDIETGVMTNPATQFANVKNGDYSTLQEPCNQLAKEMLGELGSNSRKSAGVSRTVNKKVGYVDLGLPSGTLWKAKDEYSSYYYEDAVTEFGDKLPTKEQWEELIDYCQWIWMGEKKGYKIIGQTNDSIILQDVGYSECSYYTTDGNLRTTMHWWGCGMGKYWSSKSLNQDKAWNIYFNSNMASVQYSSKCERLNVRLVSK